MTLPLPPTPTEGSDPWYIVREAFDAAIKDELENKVAPKESPALTGTPTAPTATAGTNTTQIATTQFVQSASGLLIPKSLADAKGDLIVATANDTFSRLAVGANGTVPIADSAEATGIRWGTVSGGGGSGPSNQSYLWRDPAGIVSGRVRIGAINKDGDERWHFPDVGKIYFYPAYYESTFGVNGLGVSLRGSDAAATVHVGLYSDSSGAPGTKVASGSVSGATSGWKNIDITAVTGLAAGWYWHAVLAVGAGLDIHGGWMIHPMDATNMENGIRHNAWNGFRTTNSGFTSLTNNPSPLDRIGGFIPWTAVRFN